MDELHYLYIYYLNDEQRPMSVQIHHQFFFDPNNPMKQPNIEYTTLQSCEARLFKVEAPEGSIPYLKKWNNAVMISYYDLKELRSRLDGDAG